MTAVRVVAVLVVSALTLGEKLACYDSRTGHDIGVEWGEETEETGWDVGVGSAGEASCDLKRLEAKDTSVESLQSLTVPVVISGAVDGWRALERWRSREGLRAAHGRVPIRKMSLVNATVDTAMAGPNPRPGGESVLGDVLEGLSEGLFVFEAMSPSEPLGGRSLAEEGLGEDLGPTVLDGLGFEKRATSIGGRGAGLPPHKHAAAWLAVVVGRKKWAFLPPDALSSSTDLYAATALRPATSWPDDLRTTLHSRGLLECTQGPGEVVVVPAHWWHATVNDGDVVAVGRQAETTDAKPTATAARRARCALAANAAGDVARALALEPLSIRYVLARAEELLESTEPADAYDLLLEAATELASRAQCHWGFNSNLQRHLEHFK